MSRTTGMQPNQATPLYKRPAVLRLLVIALFGEIAYAVLNISTMPVYLATRPGPKWHLIANGRAFNATSIGIVFVAYLLSEAVFKSPMGHLADRFGPKRLMLIGPSLSVCTTVATLFMPTWGGGQSEVLVIVLLRAVDGIGAAMIWPAMFAAVNEAVPDEERQEAMSLMNLCYMLGIALAFPIEGIVNDSSGVKWAGLVLAAGIFLVAALTVLRFVPDIEVHGHAAQASEVGLADFRRTMRQIPGYLLLAAVTFMGIGFPMAVFKLFTLEVFHFSEAQVGYIIFPGAIAMAAVSVPMSKFGERIGRANAVHLGIGLCAIGMWGICSGACVPALRHPWVLAAGGIPVGIGFLLAIPAWMASVSDLDPQRRATNLGAVMAAQGVGAIIGTPIGAWSYGAFVPLGKALLLGPDFSRYTPFVGCAACLTVGWVISTRVLRVSKGDPSNIQTV